MSFRTVEPLEYYRRFLVSKGDYVISLSFLSIWQPAIYTLCALHFSLNSISWKLFPFSYRALPHYFP